MRVGYGLAGVLFVGFAVRLAAFLGNRPLWTDEAFLALSLGSRSFGDLLTPLDYAQVAPPVFLLGVRLVTGIAGISEQALRFIPLLAGIAFLPVLWQLAKRFVSPDAALLATALAAISPAQLYYSNELKPYSLDSLVSAGLLLLAAAVMASPERRGLRAALTLAGIAAAWVSIPSPFVLAAIGIALLLSRAGNGHGWWAWLIGSGVAWVASFAIVYFAVYREVGEHPYMRAFWSGSYVGLGEGGSRTAWLIREALLGFFVGADAARVPAFGGWAGSLVALVIALLLWAGAIQLVRTRGIARGALICLPPLFAGMASALEAYPTATRLLMFAAPSFFIVTAAGCEALGAGLRLRYPVWVTGAAVLVLALLPGHGWGLSPTLWSNSRGVVRVYQAEADGEPVYVSARGLPIWTFYATDWDAPDLAHLRFIARVAGPDGPAFQNSDADSLPAAATGHASPSGDELVIETPRGRRIIGLPPGRQWRHAEGFSRPSAKPGWAAGEAERIIAASGSRAWLALLNLGDDTEQELLAELERRGARRISRHLTPGAALFHLHLPTRSASSDQPNARTP